MEILNTPFKHANWFVKRNEETNAYEPYLSKKIALQYFASCGDFINDKNILRYTGREKGSYRMNNSEAKYFTDLVKEKTEAKKEGEKHSLKLKTQLSATNKKAAEHFIYKNVLVSVVTYYNTEYKIKSECINVSFLDYIREQGGDSKKILSDLEEIKNNSNLQTTLF
jgi:hypothetical protein